MNEVNDESSSWLTNEEDQSKNGLKTNQETGSSSVASQPCFAGSWCSIPSFCVPDFQDDPGTRFLHRLQDRVEGTHRNPIPTFYFAYLNTSVIMQPKKTCHPCAASRIACRSSGCRRLTTCECAPAPTTSAALSNVPWTSPKPTKCACSKILNCSGRWLGSWRIGCGHSL